MYLIFQLFALLIGLSVGSFLNVCIARMPDDRSVVHPPSHCPSCGAGIKPYDNIPVLSWIILWGKCRACKTPISPLYPIIELMVGLLSLLLFRDLMPTLGEIDSAGMVAWSVYLCLIAMLVATSYIDLRHYIIPDQFSIYAIPFGVLASVLLTQVGFEGAITWQQSVVGALMGAGSLGVLLLAYWVVRREEAMGLGDVKLLGMLGAWLGFVPAIPFIIFISSVAGAIVGIALIVRQGRGLKTQLPFGPFLSAAAILYLFFGDEVMRRWFPALYILASF